MDYKNGQIYSIRSHQTPLFYIGSTCSPLAKRLYNHKKDYKYWTKNNECKYLSSYEIIKYEDHYIELLEEYPCETKKQLNKREGQIIRFYNDKCVNKIIPCRMRVEYRQDYKIKLAEQGKKYYESHKEEMNEHKKEYWKKNKLILNEKQKEHYDCECGGKYTYSNKQRHLNSKKHKNYLSNIIN